MNQIRKLSLLNFYDESVISDIIYLNVWYLTYCHELFGIYLTREIYMMIWNFSEIGIFRNREEKRSKFFMEI